MLGMNGMASEYATASFGITAMEERLRVELAGFAVLIGYWATTFHFLRYAVHPSRSPNTLYAGSTPNMIKTTDTNEAEQEIPFSI